MKTSPRIRELQDGTLTVHVSDEGSTRTLALAGELDMANAGTLATALEEAESSTDGSVRIDLSELEFIDSTGIALLVSAHHRLAASDRLSIVPSRGAAVRRVMAVTGLDAQLPFAFGNGDGPH